MQALPFTIDSLWNLPSDQFQTTALQLAAWQSQYVPTYQKWVQLSSPAKGMDFAITGIPFLPIHFFKTQQVLAEGALIEQEFQSSGTTGDVVSKHLVADLTIYKKSFLEAFRLFYGNPEDYCIIGLLPSYLERNNSSLVFMVDALIKKSSHIESGFYLNEYQKLNDVLQLLEAKGQKVILFGVSFALIDFVDAYPQTLKHTIVIETGGMKGRKQEMIKKELHQYLSERMGGIQIHSEYGMTELLSQAYAKKDGVFTCPPWMKIFIAPEDEPTVLKTVGKGVLHVIDLANVYSCAFIATEDLCELHEDGSFSILGRLDNADRRGCSLLVV